MEGYRGAGGGAIAEFEERYREARRSALARWVLGAALFASLLWVSAHTSGLDASALVAGLPGLGRYAAATLPVIRAELAVSDLAAWFWGIRRWLSLLLDTILMALYGSALGVAGGWALSFAAARNLAPGKVTCFLARRTLEVMRTVPELVFALLFVFAFGLGPMAGVLAIAVHSMGAVGKLCSEVNENAGLGPVEALASTGANWFQRMRFGVLPQVLPNFLSYGLLRFEINVRASSVLGFVGVGGIGQELYMVVRQFVYRDVSAIVLLIVAAVVVIDMLCERLRRSVSEGAA